MHVYKHRETFCVGDRIWIMTECVRGRNTDDMDTTVAVQLETNACIALERHR